MVSLSDNLKASGMFIGMVIGAGFFSLPYAISKSGLIWGAAHFILAFIITSTLHLFYGIISFHIPERYRFIGYVKTILGKKAEKIALVNTVLSYYGSFLVYSILGGFFLSNIFPSISSIKLAFAFLIFSSLLIFISFNKISCFNFYLTAALLISIVLVMVFNYRFIDLKNFYALGEGSAYYLLFPYGIFIFSMSGFSVIPEITDFFKKKSGENTSLSQFSNFRKVIKISEILIAVFYFIFIFSIIGVLGNSVSENIFKDMKNLTGEPSVILLSVVGFLAVLTSFLALQEDFKNILVLDYKISLKFILPLFFIPLFTLLLLIKNNFSLLITLIGSVGFGVFGVLILLMFEKIKKENKKEIFIGNNLFFSKIFVARCIVFLLIFGALAEIFYSFTKFFN